MTTDNDHPELAALRTLAAANGIRLSFRDYRHVDRAASPDTLVAILRSLGHDLESPADAPKALEEDRQARLRRAHEPVILAWDGHCEDFTLAVPRRGSDRPVRAVMRWEGGAGPERAEDIRVRQQRDRDKDLVELTCTIAEPIPFGAHDLRLEHDGQVYEPRVISAPMKPDGRPRDGQRRLGVFLPLYALHSERSEGTGDLGDLSALADWACGHGCTFVSTLPLLSAYLDQPFNPSPYVPVSRLFFNELFIDVEAALAMIDCDAARSLMSSDARAREVQRLKRLELVDYRAAMATKRPVLEALADSAFADTVVTGRIDAFARRNPELERFSRFRAVVERQGGDWHTWPDDPREGRIDAGDFDERARRYHVFVQWLLDCQLGGLADRLAVRDAALYLDLPVGVHGGGYDVWRFRDQFTEGLDLGAPPDPLFTGGQNWATPPIHPRNIRRRGHEYWQRVLQAHFRYAKMLRIDHVMALQRLYCIPQGMSATEGAYVAYPADELLAMLCLEAHRAGAVVVGENLGTVPPETNEGLREHGLYGMWIGEFALRGDPADAVPAPPAGQLAALNTHDMPTFAGYWQGRDLDLRRELGHIEEAEYAQEMAGRRVVGDAVAACLSARGMIERPDADLADIRDGVLEIMAESDAEFVQVNLEDLWLETEPQNVPGVVEGYPSWRHKAARGLEAIRENQHDARLLERLADLRTGRTAERSPATAEVT